MLKIVNQPSMNCNFSGLLSIAKISVNITHGEYVAVLGKSGSGKPTLINQIAELERPRSGVFQVADAALADMSETRWLFGGVLQFFLLLPTLTVFCHADKQGMTILSH